MNKNDIDELRKSMGTCPSTAPQKSYKIVRGVEELELTMYDYPTNIYKTILEGACATWGDDAYKPKWSQLSPANRFRVILAVLTGQTLPQSLESVQFSFRVNGLPRSCFDQHARARIGSVFFSIGSRDNNHADSRIILYTKLYDAMEKDAALKTRVINHLREMKDIYELLIKNKSSWQTSRALLPMSYQHSYCFSQNLLAIKSQCANRLAFHEEEYICALHWKMRDLIGQQFPLIANYLRPGCDYAKSCAYAKSYSLSNAFGCLFAGCGRWKSGTEYATFNESCSDKSEIEKQLRIKIPNPEDYLNLTEDDYDKLLPIDKKLFEAD